MTMHSNDSTLVTHAAGRPVSDGGPGREHKDSTPRSSHQESNGDRAAAGRGDSPTRDGAGRSGIRTSFPADATRQDLVIQSGDHLFSGPELVKAYGTDQDREPVVERLAWPGRLTLLAGREKLGKSTLAGAAVTSVLNGTALFSELNGASDDVLYYSLEEHPSELMGRLVRFGADITRFHARTVCHRSPLHLLERDVGHLAPSLVVIDSLTALARHRTLGRVHSTDWTGLLADMRHIVQPTNVALLLIHHARRSDGQYRGSTEVGAGVDMILEMHPGEEHAERRIEARGRWDLEDYVVRLIDDDSGYGFELAGPEQDLRRQICAYLATNPGASFTKLRNQVKGRSEVIREVLEQLEQDGRVVNRGTERNHAWHLADSG